MIEINKNEQDYINFIKEDFRIKFGYYPEIKLKKPDGIEIKDRSLKDIEEEIQGFSKSFNLDGSVRKKEIVFLRKIYCMICSDYGYTLKAIGNSINKDHSTVIYSINTGYDLLETDEEFRELYIKISRNINPIIYPHARINEVSENEQINSRSNSNTKLHSRKYNVYRPGIGSEDKFGISKKYKDITRKQQII